MPTVERDAAVGWARGGQEAAERAEAQASLREAEQAIDCGDYLTAADILHGLREGGFACGEPADRLADAIRSSLPDADLGRFDRVLSKGLPSKPESGTDADLSRPARRQDLVGPWTLTVLVGWLAVSGVFALTGPSEGAAFPADSWFLAYLLALSLPALVVWLVGFAFVRFASSRQRQRQRRR